MKAITAIITQQLGLPAAAVENVLRLLEEGCTIPFIARYRKERTGGMDEVQIENISLLSKKLQELRKRKESILKTIQDQGKLDTALQARIEDCWDAAELEDLYLPYKPKRHTRAQAARELGLEPLATHLLRQRDNQPYETAKRYVKGEVADAEAAIQGAKDIIAETVSEDNRVRRLVRKAFQREAVITSKVVNAKKGSEEAQKYSDYFQLSVPLRRCPSHRLLAMRRGENEGILRVTISIEEAPCTDRIKRLYVQGRGPCSQLVAEAVDDSYKRLLKPSIETEFAALSKEQADEEAIRVFTENLRQLLLAAPLGQKRVLAIDPGFRTGCKVVCLDSQGNLLHHTAIYPHPPQRYRMQAMVEIQELIDTYDIEAIAIGNGTANRETVAFVKEIAPTLSAASAGQADARTAPPPHRPFPEVHVVSEDGASVYSASPIAREEFPDKDVTVRGAVSIGRRLMDPLAELVKIDPKSIGVGQYQHDVDQRKLRQALDQTVELCVNSVGVNVNTASVQLLTYVSGLGPTLAQNIVDYRAEHGPFGGRSQLKKVARLGPAAFQQCAGFLRIPGADNPLDNSAVHPESYPVVEKMAKDLGLSVKQLIADKNRQKEIDLSQYTGGEIGLPTLQDIMKELEKPGRDPRQQLEAFEFNPDVKEMGDLTIGMELPGIVTNITNFGAFVDIGVHQDGLVHISQLADRFVKNPNDVVRLHQHVRVRVTEVDQARNRISLSMRGLSS